MSWKESQRSESQASNASSWKRSVSVGDVKNASWSFSQQKQASHESGASWRDALASSGQEDSSASWSSDLKKARVQNGSYASSWGSAAATEPRIRNSWSDRPVRQRRKRGGNGVYSIDDQINDMLDAMEDGTGNFAMPNSDELIARMTLDDRKAATRETVDGVEKAFVSYGIMMGGIFNAFRDSMPTVFPAAFFGDEVYQKAQQTGNEINDEISSFIAQGKARGVTKQLLQAMADYGQHDPQFSNMRRAFAAAEKRDGQKNEKQIVDELQVGLANAVPLGVGATGTGNMDASTTADSVELGTGNMGTLADVNVSGNSKEDDIDIEVKKHHYPPKVAQLFDYGMKSFFITDISIGSFITRTEVAFIPFVQSLRPNISFLLHILNFIPALSTPSEMLGFLAKAAARWVDPDNEHLGPFFDKVFTALYPLMNPLLSFLSFVLKAFEPVMHTLLDRAHIVAALSDRVLKYVMILAGMVWTIFAGIINFVVHVVLFIVQLVIQVLLSIYASPWVGELVNLLLTLVTSLI